MKRLEKITLWASAILSILFVILIFASLNDQQMRAFFSSDTLYLPSIYKDIFIDKSGISGWHINAAPNIFPDMLLFFILNAITSDFVIAAFVFSIIQYTFLLVLIRFILKYSSISVKPIHISIAFLCLSSVLLVKLINEDFIYTSYILLNAFHLGSFVMTLSCLLFTLLFFRTEKLKYLALLFIFGVLATFSDRLFIVQYPVPMLSSVVFLKYREYRFLVLKIIISIVLFTSIGLFLFHLLDKSEAITIISTQWKMFNFTNISGAWKIFAEQHLHYISSMDMRGIIDILIIGSLISIAFMAIQKTKTKLFSKHITKNEFNEMFFVYFSFFYCVIVILTPIINGSYIAWSLLRYNIYAIYFLLLLYGFLISKINFDLNSVLFKIAAHGLVISVVLFLSILFSSKTDVKSGLIDYFTYYPKSTQCLDSIIVEENLQYGIAYYWKAKLNTMFSKEDLRLYAVYPNFDAYHHATNENWFYDSARGKYQNPKFRFIYASREKISELRDIFGEIKKTIPCEGEMVVFIVDEFKFNRENRKPMSLHAIDQK